MSTITQFPSGNTQYRIEFDYLARTFVVVTLVNSSNPTLNRVLEVGRDYRFLNPTMIEMLVDQSGFDIVRIHRQTGTDLVVDFRNGSVLTASDLTNAELQSIHIAEEGRDQTVDLAKEYADAAGSYAGNAKDSEDEARRIAETVKEGLLGYITRRSFEKGFTVTTWSEVLLWEQDGEYYRWDGTLPKKVPAGSTPETSGGIGLGAWVSVGDAYLRKELFSKYILYKTPQSFGAKGDGVADDTLPLQNAMDYCQINNQKLVIPSGKYLITKPLLYKNRGFYNYEIEGQGGNVEIILTTEAKTGITEPDAFGIDVNVNAAMVVLTDTNQSKFCRISGIRFRTTVNAAYGIYLSITENSYISDCFFEGFKFGLYDKGSWVQRIERCVARNVTDTGFIILGGTSTHIKECYVDYAKRGYYLAAGYSSIQGCACDHTTRWSYFFVGGAGDNATTDTRSISMNGCGSENSGTGAAIYIEGRVALGISNYHAGNYPPYQTTKTPYLVDVSPKGVGSQITMSNVRCVNFSYLINDATSSGNYFNLTNVTSRSTLTGKYSLSATSRVMENTLTGQRYITKTDQAGIGFAAGDVVDGRSATTYSGIRNNQYIFRFNVNVARERGTTGTTSITLPVALNTDYSVAATYVGSAISLASVAPVFSVSDKTSSTFSLNATSATGSSAWSNLEVVIIVYGRAQ